MCFEKRLYRFFYFFLFSTSKALFFISPFSWAKSIFKSFTMTSSTIFLSWIHIPIMRIGQIWSKFSIVSGISLGSCHSIQIHFSDTSEIPSSLYKSGTCKTSSIFLLTFSKSTKGSWRSSLGFWFALV